MGTGWNPRFLVPPQRGVTSQRGHVVLWTGQGSWLYAKAGDLRREEKGRLLPQGNPLLNINLIVIALVYYVAECHVLGKYSQPYSSLVRSLGFLISR